jgi:hypothetical protein
VSGLLGTCTCALGFSMAVDGSCQSKCLYTNVTTLSNSQIGAYYFQNSLVNTITSGSPLGTLSLVGSSPIYTQGGTTGISFNFLSGYLSLSTIPILNDFTFSFWFFGQEYGTNNGKWRFLLSQGIGSGFATTNGLMIGSKKKSKKK